VLDAGPRITSLIALGHGDLDVEGLGATACQIEMWWTACAIVQIRSGKPEVVLRNVVPVVRVADRSDTKSKDGSHLASKIRFALKKESAPLLGGLES